VPSSNAFRDFCLTETPSFKLRSASERGSFDVDFDSGDHLLQTAELDPMEFVEAVRLVYNLASPHLSQESGASGL